MSFREYEVRKKPLFASTKRARSALSKTHPEPCSYDEFFDYLEQTYGIEAHSIDCVTFYDYTWKEDNFRFSIAYVYTEPNLYIRDVLFDEREKTTASTGWYPMVSGKRAHFTQLKMQSKQSYWDMLKTKAPYVHLGKPISLKRVAIDPSSTAILLKCENGSILLDTGFGVESDTIDEVSFIFISHFHRDHSGGLFDFLRRKEVPVILSDITLEYLINLRGVDNADKERLVKNAVLIERLIKNHPINLTLDFFASYHCPGAYGIKYKYYRDIVIFPGDFCMLNGFYDYSNHIHSVFSNPKGKTYFLTDCAIVPRGDFAITDKSFSDISEIIRTNKNHQIFLSRSPESLFNVYIKLFRMSVDEHYDWIFVVNDELFDLLQSTLRAWILSTNKADPYIRYVLGNSGINYAESYRLFPVSRISQFSNYSQRRLILLSTFFDLDSINSIINTRETDLYVSGPLAVSKDIKDAICNYTFNSIYLLSSPDWSFHTDKETLRQLLSRENQQNVSFILFHAFSKDLKKFIKEFPPELQERIKPISKSEILF